MCLYKHIIAITTFYKEAIHCYHKKKKNSKAANDLVWCKSSEEQKLKCKSAKQGDFISNINPTNTLKAKKVCLVTNLHVCKGVCLCVCALPHRCMHTYHM